ncbi:hypothetical protein J4467_02615 [Candidatus Woesearchaeota archaeon]|nr:hypothetical protein [Candidatus Woesearchaeota archaeon]
MAVKSKAKVTKVSPSKSNYKMVLWSLLALVLKIGGVAFLVQGFVMQLATGVLYYGMLHYALGIILMALAWKIHWGKYHCKTC